MEVRRFEHHVLPTAGLDGFEEHVCVRKRTPGGRHGAGNMLAMFKHQRAVPGMAWRVGGHEHRFNLVVFHELLEGGVGLLAAARLGQAGTPIGKQIAHRHHFNIRVILETERRTEAASAVADNAHANLAVGNGNPAFRGLRVGRRFLETLDRFFFLPGQGRSAHPKGGGSKPHGLKERTS